ncbi:MAG: amino acid permease [Deltaproteobacteria bacterium]|nr:amino acid permease [Deltaproteobacteria bacterium]
MPVEMLSQERKLKKGVGFFGLLAMCVGLNVGGSLFALTSPAAGLAGPCLPLAMFISSIPILLFIVPLCMLSSGWPTAGASYRYTQLVSPTLALVAGLALLFSMVVGGQPLFALVFGLFLKGIVPVNPILSGVCVLTFFYVINLLGIRIAVLVQNIMFWLLLSALILYVILGAGHIDTANFSNPFPNGIAGVLAAAGLLFTFCAGGLYVIDLGAEVIQAERNFPKALLIGIGIVLLLYIAIHIVTVGIVLWSDLGKQTLVHVAMKFMGKPALAYFVIAGGLVATTTTINVIFSIASRDLMVIAEEGVLPAFIGRVNKRFGTPHWALTFLYIGFVLALIFIPSLLFFGSIMNLGLIFSISCITLAAAVVVKHYPKIYENSYIRVSPHMIRYACFIAITLNVLIFIYLGATMRKAALVFLLVCGVSWLYTRSVKPVLAGIQENNKIRFK